MRLFQSNMETEIYVRIVHQLTSICDLDVINIFISNRYKLNSEVTEGVETKKHYVIVEISSLTSTKINRYPLQPAAIIGSSQLPQSTYALFHQFHGPKNSFQYPCTPLACMR